VSLQFARWTITPAAGSLATAHGERRVSILVQALDPSHTYKTRAIGDYSARVERLHEVSAPTLTIQYGALLENLNAHAGAVKMFRCVLGRLESQRRPIEYPQRRHVMYLIRNIKPLLLVGALLLIMGAACAPMAPVQNFSNQPIVTNRPVSLDEVGRAIRTAGVSLKMQMLQVKPGLIQATYDSSKGRSAVMDIKYDTKQYSITYKDSQGMQYDGTKILQGYNGWVQNLDRNIRAQLSAL
jgi:hypothetical protein